MLTIVTPVLQLVPTLIMNTDLVTIMTMLRSEIRAPHLTPDTSEVPDTRAVTRRVITDLTAAVKREIARNQSRQEL